jgi:hypothetical protein
VIEELYSFTGLGTLPKLMCTLSVSDVASTTDTENLVKINTEQHVNSIKLLI